VGIFKQKGVVLLMREGKVKILRDCLSWRTKLLFHTLKGGSKSFGSEEGKSHKDDQVMIHRGGKMYFTLPSCMRLVPTSNFQEKAVRPGKKY
jgi:hypothetical protein